MEWTKEQQIAEIKAETSRFLNQTDWIFQRYLERQALQDENTPVEIKKLLQKREELRERSNILEKEV